MNDKPYSPACDRNKGHILKPLTRILDKSKNVLEIGSGTGQHAIYFAEHIPHIIWQTSDLQKNHQGIINWIESSGARNVKHPILLDVSYNEEVPHFDAIFTANTFHIMSWRNVQSCIILASKILLTNSVFIVYGPFNINKEYTSNSNKEFDLMLKRKNKNMGIRELNDVIDLCQLNKFTIKEVIAMPANNQILYFEKL